ncbi:uncharacterized protein ACIB01_014074 isoform 1-T2 [Guaruba guarouba]
MNTTWERLEGKCLRNSALFKSHSSVPGHEYPCSQSMVLAVTQEPLEILRVKPPSRFWLLLRMENVLIFGCASSQPSSSSGVPAQMDLPQLPPAPASPGHLELEHTRVQRDGTKGSPADTFRQAATSLH